VCVCATVKYKCRNSDSAVLIVIKRECVTEVLINPIIRTRTRHFRHAYYPTRDNISCHSSIFGFKTFVRLSPFTRKKRISCEREQLPKRRTYFSDNGYSPISITK
jgi:hypothetical protein